jgi:hypothetical protein
MNTSTPPHLQHEVVDTRNPWSPGFLQRMPWLALGAFFVSALGLAASTGVLIYSDGKAIADWEFQPSTYLAVTSVVTNVCMLYVLKEGANISWWRLAAQGSTVGDLHRHWSYAGGFQDAILSGKHINYVALVCIITTIAQINSPLLQRASRAIDDLVVIQTPLSLKMVSAIPYNFSTGYISGRQYAVSLFTASFGDVVQNFNINASIPINNTGCKGTCSTSIDGLGLALNCSSYTVPFNLNPETDENGTIINGPGSSVQGINVFESSFYWDVSAPANMTVGIAYKPTQDCAGELKVQNCSIHTATVRYEVIIDGNASTIALNPHTTVFDDVVLQVHDLPARPIQGGTTFGGYWRALQNKYRSAAHLRFVGAVGYELLSSGNSALQYAVVNGTRTDNVSWTIGSSCDLYFRNPMDDLLAGARDLMFRTALAAVNSTTPAQRVLARQSDRRAVFQTNYAYLAGALAVTILALGLASYLFKGYYALGRKMTMSPVEVAKAFSAPLLASANSNSEMQRLIAQIGMKSIKYGVVETSESPVARVDGWEIQQTTGHSGHHDKNLYPNHDQFWPAGNHVRRLEMTSWEHVRDPRAGEIFTG